MQKDTRWNKSTTAFFFLLSFIHEEVCVRDELEEPRSCSTVRTLGAQRMVTRAFKMSLLHAHIVGLRQLEWVSFGVSFTKIMIKISRESDY